jgi:P-type Cu2+ transporter
LLGEGTAHGLTEQRLLQVAASVEAESEHPLARAIVSEADNRRLVLDGIKDFHSITGGGAQATVEGAPILIGAPKLLGDQGIPLRQEGVSQISALQAEGKTVMAVAQAGQLVGGNYGRRPGPSHRARNDRAPARVGHPGRDAHGGQSPHSRGSGQPIGHRTRACLRRGGAGRQGALRTTLAGGGPLHRDGRRWRERRACAGAGRFGNRDWRGDGCRHRDGADRADAQRPLDALAAIWLSKATVVKMRQNLFWAAIYNLIAIPVAAGVLYPLGILLSPAVAALAMSASSITVATNAVLLKRVEPSLRAAGRVDAAVAAQAS